MLEVVPLVPAHPPHPTLRAPPPPTTLPGAPPPAMTDKLKVCCAPEMAGIREALRPSMFGIPPGTDNGAPAVAAAGATAAAVPVAAAEPASVAARPVEAVR